MSHDGHIISGLFVLFSQQHSNTNPKIEFKEINSMGSLFVQSQANKCISCRCTECDVDV